MTKNARVQVIESFIDTTVAGTIVALGGSQNIGDGEFQSFVSEVVHDFISAELGDFLDGAAERKDAEHALAVNALSSQIKKLKQKVPGGLSSWRQKPNEASVALEYKKPTRYRHLKEPEDQVLEISQFDESRQQWLSCFFGNMVTAAWSKRTSIPKSGERPSTAFGQGP